MAAARAPANPVDGRGRPTGSTAGAAAPVAPADDWQRGQRLWEERRAAWRSAGVAAASKPRRCGAARSRPRWHLALPARNRRSRRTARRSLAAARRRAVDLDVDAVVEAILFPDTYATLPEHCTLPQLVDVLNDLWVADGMEPHQEDRG